MLVLAMLLSSGMLLLSVWCLWLLAHSEVAQKELSYVVDLMLWIYEGYFRNENDDGGMPPREDTVVLPYGAGGLPRCRHTNNNTMDTTHQWRREFACFDCGLTVSWRVEQLDK